MPFFTLVKKTYLKMALNSLNFLLTRVAVF